MPKLVGFVSHAFDDACYMGGKAAFRTAIGELFNDVGALLSHQRGDVNIEPYFVATEYGRELPAQLRRKIRESDFLIADLSTLNVGDRGFFNENVLFELGFAMALDIPILLIRNKESKSLPSDLKDILAASYLDPSDLTDILKARLAEIVGQQLTTRKQLQHHTDARISKTWFDADATAIHIICAREQERSRFASQSEPNYLFIDNLEDRDALLEISTFLARQYPRATLIRHAADTVPPDVLSGNLVVLGGPGVGNEEGNKITRELMVELGSKVCYGDDFDGIEYAGQRFFAELRSDDSVKLDWGCITCAQNPMNPYTRVVLCHGIFTYGTLAAAMALSDNAGALPNHLLIEDLDIVDPTSGSYHFEAIFRVPIVASGKISSPKLQKDLVRRIPQ